MNTISAPYNLEQTFIGPVIINNRSFNPGAILNATITEGTHPDLDDEKKWKTMEFKVS